MNGINGITWPVYALLSAGFAGATAILAKMGIQGVPTNLVVAIRTSVALVFALILVALSNDAQHLSRLTRTNWTFLTLSGLATGLSWLCYFRAIQLGPVSRVAPIDKLSFVIAVALGVLLFHEKLTWQLGAGAALIVAGVLLTLKG